MNTFTPSRPNMKLEALTENRPGDRCIICGAAPAIIGIFTPEDPTAWGAKNGKTRLIRYCLCDKCHGRQETPENVEKIIRAELAGGSVTHE